MVDMLLTTKLHIPGPSHVLVDRPRLIQKLEAGLTQKLTLICAPTGSGKSTLLSQWIHEGSLERRTAWYSLDEGDNDLERFVTYLVAGLRRVDDSIGLVTSTLLRSPQKIPFEILLTPLLNDVAGVSERIILVLDDYQFISAPVIHEAMLFLLSHRPPLFHIVISSRHDPPLPLGELRAHGQLNELRARDLGFLHDETADYFHTVAKIRLNPHEIDLLAQRTEGWVAGLQLASLALKDRDDKSIFVDRFAGSHTYLVDYLGEEVFQRQPQSTREFLLKTAILTELNPELCNAVTGGTNGQEMLEELRQANLFVVPLDDRREWYRYHHLFSDLLLHYLPQVFSDEIAQLHIRASRWYRQKDFFNQAIQHALAGKDHQQASELIEQVGLKMVGEGRLEALQRWIIAVPAAFVQERPYLSVFLAWGCVLVGRPNDAVPHLDKAAQGLQNKSLRSMVRRQIECQIELLRGYVARSSGDLVASIEQVQKALTHLPENNAFLRCTVHLNLGGNYWLAGDFGRAETFLLQASALINHAEAEYPSLAAAGFLGNVYLQTGRLQQLERHCQRTIEAEFAQRRHPLPAIAYVYIEKGELLYERNQLEAAADILKSAVQLGKDVDRVVNVERAMLLLALTQCILGENEATAKSSDGVASHLEYSGTRYRNMRQIEFDSYCVRLWLAQDDLTSASRWAQNYQEHRNINTTWDILTKLSFARVLLAKRQFVTAVEILTQALALASEVGIKGWMIQCLALSALCHRALRDDDKALNTIGHALSLAEPEGYVRTFVDCGVTIEDLLTAALIHYQELIQSGHSFSADYVGRLLAVVKAENRSDSQLIEPLSDRETTVLRLLVAGLSNKEIADRLVVTIGTVKQYNHVIFRKLNVHTRDQAVQRARDLHLL